MPPAVIRETRPFIPSWMRYLFIFPMLIALGGLYAISGNRKELLAGTPILSLMTYGLAILMTWRIDVEADERGFRLQPGPLPTGARPESYQREEIRAVFPRHMLVPIGKGAREDQYFAAVELVDGRWVNVRGHYKDWAGASQASIELGRLWGLAEVGAGRSGFPPGGPRTDKRAALIVLLWGGAFIGALLWGAAVEIWF